MTPFKQGVIAAEDGKQSSQNPYKSDAEHLDAMMDWDIGFAHRRKEIRCHWCLGVGCDVCKGTGNRNRSEW